MHSASLVARIVMKSQKKLGAAWTPRGMLSGEVDVWQFCEMD